jgi:four helix bundle protein
VLSAEEEWLAQDGSVKRFEDLVAWQKARVLTRLVYLETRKPRFTEDLALVRQMRRCSVSIIANIAEGFERNRNREFHQFLSIAKSSCAELRSHLYVALDAGFLDQDTHKDLMRDSEEVRRIIGGLRNSVERRLKAERPSRNGSRQPLSTQHSALSTSGGPVR